MRKFEEVLSVLTIFTIAFFITTFADTILYRSSGIYSYYFNDTQVIDELHTNISSGDIAGEIAAYFNSSGDEIFRLRENTGYDMEDIFTEDEGRNMLKIKRMLDTEGILCGISFLITFAIYFHLIRSNRKRLLAYCYKISIPVSIGAIAVKEWIFLSGRYAEIGMKMLGLVALPEDSYLRLVVGPEFIAMSSKFNAAISAAIFFAVTYICPRLTREQKIFFRG